jgi:type I restriction enzyme, S subunit
MTYLEKLLVGVEVEWKRIWEVTTWDKRFNAVDNYKQPKTIKYHHLLANEIKPLIVENGDVKLLTTNETNLWTNEELAGSLISDSEIVAIPWGGNVVVQYFKGKFLTGDNRIAVSNDTSFLNTKFLYYFLKNNVDLLESFYRGAGIKHPSMANVLDVEIPIPPLEIQQKIVAILDAFTELTAELTAELTGRKQQYVYYRHKLLSFDNPNVQWESLENLAENLDSKRKPVTSGMREAGDIPYYGASGIVDYVKDYLFDGDYLLVSEDGANLIARNTPIAFSVTGKSWVNNHAHVLKFNSYSERRFVEYYLNSIDLTPYISGAAQPKLNQKNLNSIKIPNPPFEVKEKTVSILDKFDTLTTSITEGLPKEIELRKKQYEYYRDMLLSFPKKETA